MSGATQEKGNTMLGTLSIEQTDLQRLQHIAQYRGINEKEALSEIIKHAEEEDLDEQAFDEAVRSPEVRKEILKLNEVLKSKGL